jgi:hypothetical protein
LLVCSDIGKCRRHMQQSNTERRHGRPSKSPANAASRAGTRVAINMPHTRSDYQCGVAAAFGTDLPFLRCRKFGSFRGSSGVRRQAPEPELLTHSEGTVGQ